MTTSDKVVAITASPISAVASAAASFGVTPFSSTNLKMFSSTTIASSMTMPVASDSASIVMLFSVKPAIFMNVKVPMIDAGMASAAMKVTRRFLMNRKTTTPARNLDVLPLDGVAHLIGRQPVRVEPVGVQHQLNLALALAVIADGADVLH